MRYPKALLKLLRQARSSDVVLVNFRAHEILWLVRLLTRKPIIYDAHGGTGVYTSPKPRTFVRQKISVDRIDGDWVLLDEGPAVGTSVASVGVAELYGTEFEVGH